MLIYFTSRVISSTVAFLYPGYASFKCLSQRPASEAELERWLMYWSVLGCIVGVEYVAEWLISWLPLYFPLKTIFLLYLSLPQTQGSSYLYVNYLQPFLHTHEADIDATLVKLKARVYTYFQEKFRLLWSAILGSLGQHEGEQPGATAASDLAPPPSVGDPVSGPTHLIGGLWRSYGPSIVASGASLFTMASAAVAARQVQLPSQRPQEQQSRSGTSSGQARSVSQTIAERRKQLEAELASLPPMDEYPPHSNNSSSEESETQSPRSRNGAYEEVEVPSDVEGYDVGGPSGGSVPTGALPGPARRTSWFGWGGAAPVHDKKND